MKQFAAFLKTNKKLSEASIASYLRDVRLFSAFLQKEPHTATEKDVGAYLLHMQSEGRESATVLRAFSSLRAYFGYLTAKGRRKSDPTAKIPRPQYSRKLPVILTPEEAEKLLSAPEGRDALTLRDRALLELLYGAGITVSELVALNIENINLRSRTLVLRNGAHSRMVPFGKPATTALNDYIRTARPLLFKGSGEVALFLNCNGTRISRQGIWKLLKKYKDAAGLDKEVTPHMLRHSFAAHLLERGADPGSVQEMMGFEAVYSTAIYTKINENNIVDIYKKAHPRAN